MSKWNALWDYVDKPLPRVHGLVLVVIIGAVGNGAVWWYAHAPGEWVPNVAIGATQAVHSIHGIVGLLLSKEVIAVCLGWLLGVYSTSIVDSRKHKRRVASVRVAAALELRNLAYEANIFLWDMVSYNRTVDADVLRGILMVCVAHEGAQYKSQCRKALEGIISAKNPADALAQHYSKQPPKQITIVRICPTPVLNAALEMVADFSQEEQAMLLKVHSCVAKLEWSGRDIQTLAMKTLEPGVSDQQINRIRDNVVLAYGHCIQVIQGMTNACFKYAYVK